MTAFIHARDGIDDLINQNANSRALAPQAVASQVVLMVVISVSTVFAFNVLRPKNKIIYEPKVKYHVGEKQPPRISNSIFGWVSPVLHTKEPELVDKIGMDAVTFLRFLRMMRWLFTAIAALAAAALIPADVVYNVKNVDSKARDVLSMLTIRDVHGNTLFIHVAASYAFTLLVLGFTWVHWRAMVRLRHAWYRSPEYAETFYARTLVVTHVPKQNQSDEGIRAVFESVQVPYPTTSVHIGRKVGKLPELIEYHNETVCELEYYLVRYLKGGRIGKTRPTVHIGGHLGMGGKKVDAIDYYSDKLQRTEAMVEEYRNQIDARKAENYGFASMAAVPYAHVVARLLQNKHPKGTTIALAPNPRDIIWQNLTKSDAELYSKKTIGFFWLALVCFLNTLPLFVISILANLGSLTIWITPLNTWKNDSPTTFNIVSGVLPPAVSALFGYLLPRIMRWLSRYQGALTHSRLDRAVVARYFAFLVISQLVIFTLIGVGFNSVKEIIAQIGTHSSFKEIINQLHTLPDTINRTYIEQSSYWLTFFPLRGFLAVFDLAQIINLLWTSFKTHVFGRTPRDIREWTKPPDFEFAVYYSNMLFMACVALVFAPLAPLVAIAAAIVFWISSWVYKYQLMFVFTTKVESGGRLWNVVINRVLVSTMLMQALMMLTMGLQYGFKQLMWLWTIPPIFFVLGFKVYLTRTFDRPFRYYIPSDQELATAKVHSERSDMKGNRLSKRFGHPALHSDLYTPMLHANMMALLPQVYRGKIASSETKVSEFGGAKLETAVVSGGVTFAGVNMSDLEYDPAQYARDRDQDSDARSIASGQLLSDTSSLAPSKSVFYADGRGGAASPAPQHPAGYDRYMQRGPAQTAAMASREEFELARFDTNQDYEPLLAGAAQSPVSRPPNDPYGYRGFEQGQGASAATLPQYPGPAASNVSLPGGGYREAPVHRTTNPTAARQPSGYTAYIPPEELNQNMAGRGTYRG